MGKCIDRGYRGPYVEITICRDCYHKDVCETGGYLEQNECGDKKAKDRILELPCKVGENVYTVATRVGGKPHVRRMTLTSRNLGNVISRLGRDVYITLAEAEKALGVLNND